MPEEIFNSTADSMARAISLNGFSFRQDGRNLLRLIEYVNNNLADTQSNSDRAFKIKGLLREYNAINDWNTNANPMLDALVDLYFAGKLMGMEI